MRQRLDGMELELNRLWHENAQLHEEVDELKRIIAAKEVELARIGVGNLWKRRRPYAPAPRIRPCTPDDLYTDDDVFMPICEIPDAP